MPGLSVTRVGTMSCCPLVDPWNAPGFQEPVGERGQGGPQDRPYLWEYIQLGGTLVPAGLGDLGPPDRNLPGSVSFGSGLF